MRMRRLIGVGIVGAAVLAAVLVVIAVSRGPAATEEGQPREGKLFGLWKVFYSTEAPGGWALLVAIAVAIAAAVAVAVAERRITNRARRTVDPDELPLSARYVMGRTRGVHAGPVTITVLIPAHNEASCISETLASLYRQDPPPNRVVVVADNCTDATVELALAAGAEVFETVGNTHKKAGALNQAIAQVLPGMGDNDTVMVMDADTQLDEGFLAGAIERLSRDRALMAVGGLFYGEEGAGLIGQFQRNEYMRYQRELKRRRGRVFVLTGTASVFRSRALRAVAAERGGLLPGVPGDVYDTVALTEDNELTIALKSLGALIISPAECTVVTEVMPTWKMLWAQRLRWQRGALENLGQYGMRPATVRYWAQQLGIGYGTIALAGYLTLMTVMAVATEAWVWFPFWATIGLVFMLERVVTAWKGGWRARILAALLLPELIYAMFLNLVYLRGVWDITWAKPADWAHLPAKPQADPSPQTAGEHTDHTDHTVHGSAH